MVDECRVNHLSHVELVDVADPSSLSKGPTLTVVVGDSFRVARMGSRALRFVLPACRRRGASALVALLAGAPSSCRPGKSADFWLETGKVSKQIFQFCDSVTRLAISMPYLAKLAYAAEPLSPISFLILQCIRLFLNSIQPVLASTFQLFLTLFQPNLVKFTP